MDTEDPDTIIELKQDYPILSFKYYKTKSGEEWMLFGKCNCCGQCQDSIPSNPNIVWTGIPVGQAGAEYDIMFNQRKDVPCRPEISKLANKCVLWGYFLIGH